MMSLLMKVLPAVYRKKVNTDEEDKKFFISLPTCYALFFLHLIPGMLHKAIVPLQVITKVGKK